MSREHFVGRTLILLVLTAAIAASGCGFGRPPTQEAYIVKMDKLCQATKDKAKFRPRATTIEQQATNLDEVVKDNTTLLRKLRAERPPKDHKAVDQILAEFDQLLTKAKDLEAAAKAKIPKTYNAAYADIGAYQHQVTKDASAYGFRSCGI